MSAGLIAIAVAGGGILAWIHRRDQARARIERAGWLRECVAAVSDGGVTYDDFGYPVLSGSFGGAGVRADLVVDSLGVRKLPSLWLRVTLLTPVSTTLRTAIMMRPLGTEFFSPFNDLPHRLALPVGLADGAVMRGDGEPEPGVLAALARQTDFFAGPRAKELIIAPGGVRLTWQADEAERGDYLMLRQARFRRATVCRVEMEALLRRGADLVGDLSAQRGRVRHAA